MSVPTPPSSLLSALLDNVQEGCQLFGPDERLLYLNATAAKQAGKPLAQMLGQSALALYPEPHGAKLVQTLRACLQDNERRTLELQSNARVFVLRFQPFPEGVCIYSTDISEQKRVDLACRNTENRYRELTEQAELAFATCTLDEAHPPRLLIIESNTLFSQLCQSPCTAGAPFDALLGLDPPSSQELLSRCRQCLLQARAQRFECSTQGRVLQLIAYPDEDRVVLLLDDITRRRQAELESLRFSRQLEELTRVVRNLARARSRREVYSLACQAARRLLDSDGSSLALIEGDECFYVAEDAIAPLWKGLRFPVDGSVAGRVIREQRGLLVSDIRTEAALPRANFSATFVRSFAMVPIGNRAPTAALGSFWQRVDAPTQHDLKILQALGDATSVALENVGFLEAIEEGKARARAIYDHLPHATLVWKRHKDGFLLFDINQAARNVAGQGLLSLLGHPPAAFSHHFSELPSDLQACFASRTVVRRSRVEGCLPGMPQSRLYDIHYCFIPNDMVLLHLEDITQRRATEEQLRSALRLEAVGRLAGGVAHDFNNLLSVIISYTDFAIDEIDADAPLRADLIEVRQAARRAASLTKQLLAFSRKQVLEPKLICLNDVLSSVEGMIRRLIGSNIDFAVELDPRLGHVLADPGQLEQVIVNLCVNARDAMPNGGRLVLQSANVDLDEHYPRLGPGEESGRYIMLRVQDSGVGIDATTKEHIFEPFFTTKAQGRGTGLGLATVYGIVTQSGGHIWLDSEPEQGCVFEIYLPRIEEAHACVQESKHTPSQNRPGSANAQGTSGSLHETILVVDDTDSVRRLSERILRQAGFRVLSASHGEEAIWLCNRPGNEVDLLLTDIVMPQMSGRELAQVLREQQPDLAVLYMSGYTDELTLHQGTLGPDAPFIPKPFSALELTKKVRDCLDERHVSS